MLVTINNFKGITAIGAVVKTGNPRVDVPGNDSISEMIAKYEPEYFNKMFGSEYYAYILSYTGTDTTILSIKSNITEAVTCYVFNNILRERKCNYNGETVISAKSDGNPAQPIEEKGIEVHNRMVQCNRNAIELISAESWETYNIFVSKSFIELELC